MYTLATICFMIYTTELNYAHADDEDLGSASSSLDASVTVGTACNFSGNVDNQHMAIIGRLRRRVTHHHIVSILVLHS